MTVNRHSVSSRGSDASATMCDPNSPINQKFPPATRSSISTVSDEADEHDVTEDLNEPVEGWPRVALQMSKTPDFAAFSRFRDLNIKSLLYYQAQLTSLRRELHKQEHRDKRNGNDDEENNTFASRADFLVAAEGSEQLKLIREIRKVLKEYNEALLQYTQVSALPEPDDYNMKNFRKWLRHSDDGNFMIGGEGEQSTWGNLYQDPDEAEFKPWRHLWRLIWTLVWTQDPPNDDLDLVVTRAPRKIDGFTRWVACYFIPYFEDFKRYRQQQKAKKQQASAADPEKQTHRSKPHRLQKKPRKKKHQPPESPRDWVPPVKKQETLATWSEKGMLRFTSAVSTVVACLLPTVAITILSQLHGMRSLLLCIAGFAVFFAIGLIFLTSGTSSRVEIFSATAAFSAVLVVFISVPVVNVSAPGVNIS